MREFNRGLNTLRAVAGVYTFVQFTERLGYEKGREALAAAQYHQCDFRELLAALSVFDGKNVKFPMETNGGNTRGDVVVLGETSLAENSLWVPGAQVSYHEVNSWQLLLARNWDELMTKKWLGHWHVLVRLGKVKATLQKLLWYTEALVSREDARKISTLRTRH